MEKTTPQIPPTAIGQKETMTDEQLAGKHVDAKTGFVFETEEDYIAFKHPKPEKKEEESKK